MVVAVLASQIANVINSQQLCGKQVPLGLRHILLVHEVRDVPCAVFVGDILLYKLDDFTWGETENLVD